MQLSIKQLTEINYLALKKEGLRNQDIETIQQAILYGQLRGNFQSLISWKNQIHKEKFSLSPLSIEKETKISAVVNGEGNHPILVMLKAKEIAQQKAREHGVGIIGAICGNEGTGAIGYYVNELAKKGCIALAVSGSTPRQAPFGASEALFGTNPIAVGIPKSGDPLVLDMATAKMAFYKIVEHQMTGKLLKEGIALNANGRPTEDPAEAAEGGSILPFGEAKGSSFALIVQILTGPLFGCEIGNLIACFDPELFQEKALFYKHVNELISKLKKSKPINDREVFYCGEKSLKKAKEALKSGYVEINDELILPLLQRLNDQDVGR